MDIYFLFDFYLAFPSLPCYCSPAPTGLKYTLEDNSVWLQLFGLASIAIGIASFIILKKMKKNPKKPMWIATIFICSLIGISAFVIEKINEPEEFEPKEIIFDDSDNLIIPKGSQ